MKCRSKAQMRTTAYAKLDFSGDPVEKAYLIGFCLGDLNAYKTSENAETIVVRCHTTKDSQIKLLKTLFEKYGQVSVAERNKRGSVHINCFLNETFDFLLPKSESVMEWIREDFAYSAAFAAGYFDAEANFGIYDGRARFKIDSYDKSIIHWLYYWFSSIGVECPEPCIIGRKSQSRGDGSVFNNDLWRLRVSEMESLLKLVQTVNPYIKHQKRKSDTKMVKQNILERKKNAGQRRKSRNELH